MVLSCLATQSNAKLFHMSLWQKLPRGDWHCPNCSCKFCGLDGIDASHGDGITVSPLLSCSQCEEKCMYCSLVYLFNFVYCFIFTFFLMYMDRKNLICNEG